MAKVPRSAIANSHVRVWARPVALALAGLLLGVGLAWAQPVRIIEPLDASKTVRTGGLYFGNSIDSSPPAALQPLIMLIRGLDDFQTIARAAISPLLSGKTSPGVARDLVPGDLATIYDIGPLYQQGITGSGQKIVIPGQTDVYLSDIESFRPQYGLRLNDPTFVLAPGSARIKTGFDPIAGADARVGAP